MSKDTLLGMAWPSALLAYPVGELWNWNVGSLLIAVFLLSLGAGPAKPRWGNADERMVAPNLTNADRAELARILRHRSTPTASRSRRAKAGRCC